MSVFRLMYAVTSRNQLSPFLLQSFMWRSIGKFYNYITNNLSSNCNLELDEGIKGYSLLKVGIDGLNQLEDIWRRVS